MDREKLELRLARMQALPANSGRNLASETHHLNPQELRIYLDAAEAEATAAADTLYKDTDAKLAGAKAG